MEPFPSHFLLSFFCSLILLSHAKLSLDPSDQDAFMAIRKSLGLHSTQQHRRNPCTSHGVVCESRISNSNYTSVTLKITHINLDSQQLHGSIPKLIGKLSELRELSLSNNHLTGQIPPQILNCRKLEVLNLNNNRFSGNIPPEISELVHLRVLELSSNGFSGDLSFIKHFPNLEILSLSDNLFVGTVPGSLRSFRNLRFFNISGNDYIIQSPEATKKNLIPRRFIFAESSTNRSNDTRRGAASPASAPSPSAVPVHHRHKKHRKLSAWILGFLAGALAGGASGMIFSVLIKLLIIVVRGGDKDTGISIFSPLIKKEEDLAFLEKDDGLASMELIGRGGCGEVYRAQLPGEDGKLIAVKKITEPPKEANEIVDEESKQMNKKMRQIRSEIKTVGQIRHRNLLPLLAHVSRPNCHYLVYEYMKNGSLQDILYQVSEGSRELDWLARHRIALGVAAGLEYLHFNNQPRIIHRDLKPANVLLDNDMEARIADFGLAKAMPDAKTHMSSSNVAGTLGYIAPEYHQTMKFTDKCDIFSFGVLLGVLVIGKLPTDQFFQETDEVNLVKWMRNIMTSEEPKRAICENLMGNGFEEQMLQVLKIACFCTLDDPKQRPNSKDVGCMLSQIKH